MALKDKEILGNIEKKVVKGITSKKKEFTPVHPTDPNPDLLHVSKAEFIRLRKLENERKLKIKEFGEGLDKEIQAPEIKKASRPKKIVD